MKKLWMLVLAMALGMMIQAQSTMWVFFTDKGLHTAEQLHHPENFLSEDAIARRIAKNVPLTEEDLPVLPAYVQELRNTGLEVVATSRWLNAAAVKGDVTWDKLAHLPYVKGLRPVATFTRASTGEEGAEWTESLTAEGPYDYGRSEHQNTMINIAPLHDKGITGKGVTIAVLDAGFPGVDKIPVFEKLRNEGRIVATYDFVEDTTFVYWESSHGTNVLSTIAADLPGEMVGTAPDVSVVLCRTEYAPTETQVEEHYFMQAVEFADSVGVDVIHASLGYTEFDNPEESYTYQDLNGDKAITTRAVDMAAQRGIVVTISAGNEGADDWRYIAVPCDADSILCVGAVDRDEQLAYFSSVGPTADGRIKPDVVAMGVSTTVANPSGRIGTSNGTSFSGPIMAGVMCCLRQAHPDRPNMDLIQAIRLSGDQYNFPDNEYGYGVPDAAFADSLLAAVKDLSTVEIEMDEKPSRETEVVDPFASTGEEEEAVAIEFTTNPKTEFKQKRRKIILDTEDADAAIKGFQVFRGSEMVDLDPMDVDADPYRVVFKTKYLLPGDYYIRIETPDFEEFIQFTIE